MRNLILLPLLLLGVIQNAHGQSIQAIARNHADSVVLRWAPVNAIAWERYASHGYRVERIAITNTTSRRDPFTRIGPDRILPLTLEELAARFPADHTGAAALAQLMHAPPKSPAPQPGDMMAAKSSADELTMRWSTCLLLADLEAPIAQAQGLRLVDREVRPNTNYLYRVIVLDPEFPDTALVSVDRTLGPEAPPNGPFIHAEENERRVDLRWEREQTNTDFTGFWVERSTDGRTWSRLHSAPFISTDGDAEQRNPFHYYSDTTLTRNYEPHRYRVIGITPFGELSPNAPEISAMGRDRTPPPPPMLTEVQDERGRLVVHWEQPEQASDLKGYRVEKAPTAKGGHYPLHLGLLPTSARSFADTSTFLLAENHYRVAAIDTAGNVSHSTAGYGHLLDSIAPAAPMELTGNIDTSGVVTVRWKLGKEPDILGYRVFFANATDHEFNNLSPEPFADTVYVDTLQLNTLTKRIHYRVVAVDRNYNHSPMSAMLTLVRPDTIPPVTPVFKNYLVSDSAVVIHFIPSSSTDVARHELYRMQPNDPERTLVLSLNANDDRRMWTDTTVSGPAYYSYQMLAVDSAGNVSKDGVPLEVRVHERMKRDQVLNVRATRMDENVVQVNWKGPAGKVRHYVIYRSKDLGTLMPLGSVPSDTLSYSDIRLAGKGSYTYSVQAVFEDGSGSPIAYATKPVDLR
ncbi:MAG: hypothetical protein IPL64_04470 [Flavobacteriales bacterium]|nr:hypothetical protein [Flavobacteriales bacterium]